MRSVLGPPRHRLVKWTDQQNELTRNVCIGFHIRVRLTSRYFINAFEARRSCSDDAIQGCRVLMVKQLDVNKPHGDP